MSPSDKARRDQRRLALARELAHSAALVAAAGAVLYIAILLPSRLRTERLREQRDALAEETRSIERENKELAEETRALDGDSWEIERALRARLGFVRPGERVVVVSR